MMLTALIAAGTAAAKEWQRQSQGVFREWQAACVPKPSVCIQVDVIKVVWCQIMET